MKCKYFLLGFLLTVFTTCYSQWIPTGGPAGGYVRSLSSLNGHVFTSVGTAGIFRTSTAGVSWELKNNGLPPLSAVSLLSTFQNKIYAGLYTTLFVSTNYGKSWSQFGNSVPSQYPLTAIALSNEYIFAVSQSVYRSSDNGMTWENIGNGLPESYSDIKIAGGTVILSSDNPLCGGIFRSTNNGINWTKTYGNLGSNLNSVLCLFASDNNRIYAGTRTNGLQMSTNNGINWTRITPPGYPIIGGVRSIAVSGNIIFIAADFGQDPEPGEGILRSTDNGISWTYVNKGLSDLKVTKLLIDSTIVYSGTKTGVYRSTNWGSSWHQINSGIGGIVTTCLEGSSNMLITGSYLMGLFRSSNGGQSWEPPSYGMIANEINKLAIYDNKIYAGTSGYCGEYGGLYSSSDAGRTWFYLHGANEVFGIVAFNNNIFIGTWGEGIKRSTDNGLSWVNINQGLPSNFLLNLALIDTVIFASSSLNATGIYRSNNKGNSWININNGIPFTVVSCMKTNGNKIYVNLNSVGKYVSSDYGNSWTQLGNVNTNFTDFEFYQNHIFASGNGVYHSSDGGVHWRDKSEGLWNKEVQSLKYLGGYLYAGIYGASVWKRSVSEIIGIENSNSEIPCRYELSQNYPNPFNPTTSISFSIPKLDFVILEVFNTQGKLIKTLVKGTLGTGTYKYYFDASSLPAGVYFYRLFTKQYQQTRKMILLK